MGEGISIIVLLTSQITGQLMLHANCTGDGMPMASSKHAVVMTALVSKGVICWRRLATIGATEKGYGLIGWIYIALLQGLGRWRGVNS